ncbi:uncharacterized protein LOC111032954, partial [Myzus persicae]|uniref:uncharacterized protein LOC111032954 n=1 Tax=Myzus persicae TaxID=13164 RepID=UPI000B9324CA
MSSNEKENRPESDDRAIQVTNCTIYVGRVRIVIDPRLNADVAGIVETRVTEDNDLTASNTPPKQSDFVGVRSTKPRSQRQSITTAYAARPKTTKVGPTSRQSACLRPATSQLSCCLHGGGRCNYEARFGAGSDNYIAGIDDCNDSAKNGYSSRRNINGRSPIWGTQNGGRLSPLRLVTRDQSVVMFDRSTESRTPVPSPSQPKPPVRQDMPVELYAGSRLPVPVRSGRVTARIPRIDRAGDGWSLSRNDGQNSRRCATADIPPHTDDGINGRECASADKPHDTDDRPNDTNDKPNDTDDMQHGSADGPHDTDDRQNTTEGPHDTDDIRYDSVDGSRDTDDKHKDTTEGPHDIDGRQNDVVDLLDHDDTAVVPIQPSMGIDESAASMTSEQWSSLCSLQALDDMSLTGSQPVVVNTDSLSDASDHSALQLVSQN